MDQNEDDCSDAEFVDFEGKFPFSCRFIQRNNFILFLTALEPMNVEEAVGFVMTTSPQRVRSRSSSRANSPLGANFSQNRYILSRSPSPKLLKQRRVTLELSEDQEDEATTSQTPIKRVRNETEMSEMAKKPSIKRVVKKEDESAMTQAMSPGKCSPACYAPRQKMAKTKSKMTKKSEKKASDKKPVETKGLRRSARIAAMNAMKRQAESRGATEKTPKINRLKSSKSMTVRNKTTKLNRLTRVIEHKLKTGMKKSKKNMQAKEYKGSKKSATKKPKTKRRAQSKPKASRC